MRGAEGVTVKVDRQHPPFPRSPAAGTELFGDGRLVEPLGQGDADAGHRLVRASYPGDSRYLPYIAWRATTTARSAGAGGRRSGGSGSGSSRRASASGASWAKGTWST